MAGKGRVLIPGLYDTSDESDNDDANGVAPLQPSDDVMLDVTALGEEVKQREDGGREEHEEYSDPCSVATAEELVDEAEECPPEQPRAGEEEEEEYDPNDAPFLIRVLPKPADAGDETPQQAADETASFEQEQEEEAEADQENNFFVVDVHERCVRILPGGYSEQQYTTLEKIPPDTFAMLHERVRDVNPEDDDHFYCSLCVRNFRICCPEHPLYRICDRNVTNPIEDRAKKTAPAFIRIKQSPIPNAGYGAFTGTELPVGLVFGPYQGILGKEPDNRGYSWEIRTVDEPPMYLDGSDPKYSNWMRYINSPRFDREQNLVAFQYNGSVYYRVIKPIDSEQELLVWYGAQFGKSLGVMSTKKSSKSTKLSVQEFKNPFIK